jgi:glucose-6-phosphate dehydrogenase assembly protein OpcA
VSAVHAHADEWVGEDVTIAEIERELARLRAASEDDKAPDLRTSVMTHMGWAPRSSLEAALQTLQGLEERHPSRTIILVPDGCARVDGLDAAVSLRCFPLESGLRHICTEVIELRLSGRRAEAPASIVTPLLIPDLPVFLRWREQPPFGAREFEQLLGVTDRLVVDSAEWTDVPTAYEQLADVFERAAVSDIAWARTLEWRRALAGLWPEIGELGELRVAAPLPEALLLAGWLRSRLKREFELEHDDADEIELVAVDGQPVESPAAPRLTPSDLLSAELDNFSRDPVYEDALRAASSL